MKQAGVTAEAKPVSDFSSAGAGASTFYSPDLQLAITITGQLNLRTLIAAWEQAQLNADTIQKE